jgi:Holliday junction resolvase-like predicted endonuclease
MHWLTEEPDPVADQLAKAQEAVVRQAATGYLTQHGLRILATNWRSRDGAVDVIAADGRVLVICDIRQRTGRGRGRGPLSRTRGRRLRVLGVRWMTEHAALFEQIGSTSSS